MSERKLQIISEIDKITKMSELEDIFDACQDRMGELRKAKTRKLKALLHVGDVIRLSDRMKPAYLCEIEGPITEMSRGKATIQLPEDPSLRKMSGLMCIVPLSAIAARVSKAQS